MTFSWAQAQAHVRMELEEAGVRYAWMVTHEWEMDDDWDGNGARPKGRWHSLSEDDVVCGPSAATEDDFKLLHSKGRPFRLDYDGDGPCAKGTIWCSDSEDPSLSEACFAPMDDYGRGNYGAAHLFYRNATGAWEEL